MHLYVGIDLAWRARARTGLAAVDDSGRLVASGSAVTDDEVVEWIGSLGAPVVVGGIDAPLVVRNPTGQRRAENLVQRAYGRYGAGPYPSNRANPLFDPPRGEVLAERLGWAIDPDSPGRPDRPVCVEVYPHPAMVTRFGLERVLPYKAKKGRTPAGRREAFLLLLGHLEAVDVLGLARSDRWAELRGLVEGATRHVDLERIEDEIDAVVCAHVAWLWHHDRPVFDVFGDRDDGFIVVPRAPRPVATVTGVRRELSVIEPYQDEDGNEVVTTGRYESSVSVTFRGRHNRLVLADGAKVDHLKVTFDCDNGTLRIGRSSAKHGGRWGVRIGQDATVTIGDDVTTTGVCIISAVEGVTVTVGDDVMLASQNQLRADDGHPIFDVHTGLRVNPARSITIGHHVWLGLGATVLAGGEVGDGSVVGFGSTVTGRIPNNCVAVGTPARVVRRDVAWERPHLSVQKPPYKPDASTVRRSAYWNPTVEESSSRRTPRQLAGRVRRRLRRYLS